MSGTSRPPRPLQASLQRPDAQSLARLVALAPEGSRITLSSGVYHCHRPLTISRAVHLVGHAEGGTVILGLTTREPLFRVVQGGSLTASSLKLARPVDPGDSSLDEDPNVSPGGAASEHPTTSAAALISVEDGELHCHHCEFIGGWSDKAALDTPLTPSASNSRCPAGAMGEVAGEDSVVPLERRPKDSLESPQRSASGGWTGLSMRAGTARLREVTVTGWAVGARVGGRGRLATLDTRWRDNGRGVLVEDEGALLLTRGQLVRHDLEALRILGSARASLEKCTLQSNAVGLCCGDEGKVEVAECLFEEHVEVGLRAEGEARLSAHESHFRGNAVGLNVRGEALVKVFENLFEASAACAVRVEGAGCGRVSDNVIRAAAQDGVCVLEQAQPELVRNHITRSRGVGVRYGGQAGGFARDNLLEHNGSGVVVAQEAAPLLRDNRLWSNEHHGALVKGRAQATLRGNHCLNNHRHGLLFRHTAGGDVVDNLIEGGAVGVRVSDESSPTLRGNRCLRHHQVGFLFEDRASSLVEDNDISECVVGVQVMERARPTLVDNRLLNNSARAIEVLGSGTGLVRGNTCRGSAVGIHVHPGAGPVLLDNLFGDNERDVLLPPLTAWASSAAPVAFAVVPAQTPRRLRGGALKLLRPGTLMWASPMMAAAALSVLGEGVWAWLAGWVGLAALPWAGTTAWRLWRRRALAISGQRVEAHVLDSDPETGQVALSFSVGGVPRVSRLKVPVSIARAHPRGIAVPALVAPARRVDGVLFPTLEGVSYVADVVAEDMRASLSSNQAPADFEPLREASAFELWSRRGEATGRAVSHESAGASRRWRWRWRGRADRVGVLTCSPEFVEQRAFDGFSGGDALSSFDKGQGRVGRVVGRLTRRARARLEGESGSQPGAVRVSWGEPFVVQLTVWPRSRREAELCVVLRQVGAQVSQRALCFAVTLPQRDLDREIPVMQRDAPMLRQEDFAVVWSAICAGARVHGEDLSGRVRLPVPLEGEP